MKPIIGIISNQINDEYEVLNKLQITYTATDNINAISEAGGDPVIIPINNMESVRKYANIIDGLLLAGGQDVSPLFYGEEPNPKLGQTLARRDAFEIEIIKEMLKLQKPIFGICRGLQIINVALGGTLYQDMKYVNVDPIKHWQDTHLKYISHTVKTTKDSRINKILGDTSTINSLHHQAVKTLGINLKATAFASDGLIEAIESEIPSQYILAVQWHPEALLQDKHEASQKLFKDFVMECKRGL
ncbi:MAG: gamma-glutamyl-gamma-aminobutyrate hydrolase family protein [Gemella sp.]|nr:gamma-glutamyl-gamma-aminobutyrate hydrolase family protein [Gemella sp.]